MDYHPQVALLSSSSSIIPSFGRALDFALDHFHVHSKNKRPTFSTYTPSQAYLIPRIVY